MSPDPDATIGAELRGLLPIIYTLVVDQVISRHELSLIPALALCFAETVETDAQQIAWYVDVLGIWIPEAFIGLAIALLFMGAISPLLALMAAIAAPLTALISHLMGLRGRRVADAYRTRYGGYSSWLFEIIRGAADLQQIGATTTVARWLVARLRGLIHLKVRQSLVELTSERVGELVATVLEVAFFVAVSALVLSDRLTIGGYVAVATYFLTARAELSGPHLLGRGGPDPQCGGAAG